MDGLGALLFGFQEYFVELLKITLHAGTNWLIEVLNSTLNIGVTYFLRGLGHAFTFLIPSSLQVLRYFLEIGIHYSVDFLSILTYLVVEIVIQGIGLVVKGFVFSL